MPLFFLGTREWRNRQTRTVQVRVPVMEWGFNSPLAHDETADPLRICGFCFPWLRLVAPRVFRAPSGAAVGLGCFVCPWAAARPRAVRAASLRLGASPRSPARPRHRPRAPQPGPSTPCGRHGGSRVLSFWGARVRVVTNVVNPRCFSCGFLMRCYKRRQSNGYFAENAGFWAQIDDVCNRGLREAI